MLLKHIYISYIHWVFGIELTTNQKLTLPETNSSPLKIDRLLEDYFPFGARLIFRCELLNFQWVSFWIKSWSKVRVPNLPSYGCKQKKSSALVFFLQIVSIYHPGAITKKTKAGEGGGCFEWRFEWNCGNSFPQSSQQPCTSEIKDTRDPETNSNIAPKNGSTWNTIAFPIGALNGLFSGAFGTC